VRRVANGYTNGKGKKIEDIGGGFRYVQLGEPLFDAAGRIKSTVRFRDLARHVFFTETGTPLPHDAPCDKPLLGVANGTGVYLLYNGILKDKSVDGGNVLTQSILDVLPMHDGPKVIYAASSRVSPLRLKAHGVVFKQTPYAIKVR
jgi:adenine-specific DNA-methyltransferase